MTTTATYGPQNLTVTFDYEPWDEDLCPACGCVKDAPCACQLATYDHI